MADDKFEIDYKKLLNDLGLENLTDEQVKAFSEKIDTLLEDRILLRVSAELVEKGAPEDLPEDEIIEKLPEFGIDINAIAFQEGQILKDELMGNLSYLKGFIDGAAGENVEADEEMRENAEGENVKHSDF